MSASEFQKTFGRPVPEDAPKAKAQIRLPKARKMNKTEAEFMAMLKHDYPHSKVFYEPLTLRLPSGTKYTPDFMLITFGTEMVIFFEVKGPHIHSKASLEKFKAARAAFPFWSFTFAQKTKDGWATA